MTQLIKIVDPAKRYQTNSARALWLARLKEFDGHALSEFIQSVQASPPSTPKQGYLKGQLEPVLGWLRLFENEGVLQLLSDTERANWERDELEAAIDAYIEMLAREQSGESVNKKSYYRRLAQQFGRTEKAYEYQFQNISAILDDMGLPWISGLKPAKNVGENVRAVLNEIIRGEDYFSDLLSTPTSDPGRLDRKVDELVKRVPQAAPAGIEAPRRTQSNATVYERDPRVKAWVLTNAAGTCERCDTAAPFTKPDGQPFLEVHHLRQLANGGSDQVSNAVALCPNCHRELHHGMDANKAIALLYAKLERLIEE